MPNQLIEDPVMAMDPHPTKLEYYDNMWKLQSHSTFLSYFQVFSSLSDIHYKFLGVLTSNYLRVNLRFRFLLEGRRWSTCDGTGFNHLPPSRRRSALWHWRHHPFDRSWFQICCQWCPIERRNCELLQLCVVPIFCSHTNTWHLSDRLVFQMKDFVTLLFIVFSWNLDVKVQ